MEQFGAVMDWMELATDEIILLFLDTINIMP